MKWLSKSVEVFSAIGFLAATLIVFVNVIFRVFNLGFTWGPELIRYLLIWIIFIGSSVCIVENSHINIDFISGFVKGRVKKGYIILLNLIGIVFSVLFLWFGLQIVNFVYGTDQLASSLQIPMYIVYLVLPIAGLIFVIRYVQNVVLAARGSTDALHNADTRG